jgi:hypothetical protein
VSLTESYRGKLPVFTDELQRRHRIGARFCRSHDGIGSVEQDFGDTVLRRVTVSYEVVGSNVERWRHLADSDN